MSEICETVEGNNTSNGRLKIGDTFSSLAELEKKVNELQNETYSIFYKRNCLSKAEGLKKKRKKVLKDGIEYHNLKLCCKKVGHNMQSTSTGDRESWTFKTNCPAFIMFAANNEGDALFVKNMNLTHNHECTKDLFECSGQLEKKYISDR
ncbi:uncharacterized protein LOC127279766 [Leptopilina boulardi]|uniref:uncharacterized protein LOC127279766 n=1 Tax=Leptopilina boulardi TaxID=63433 RepID=UPI0021F65F41|nr:uncharacterized protein LOC127279766 [Leptopilina boulardi]